MTRLNLTVPASVWLRRCAAGLLLAAGMAVQAQPANDAFANAEVISGIYGSTPGDTTLATTEAGEPSHAGQVLSGTVWYQWTAPKDGVVQFDTFGTGLTNDTVLAVYTGTNLTSLTQVGANDDVYPNIQINEDVQNIMLLDSSNATVRVQPISGTYGQPHSGPSLVHVTVKAGTVYYVAVGSKISFHYTGAIPNFFFDPINLTFTFTSGYIQTAPAPFVLNWALHPSGVFRFATERFDQTGMTDANGFPLPLYETSETEATRLRRGTYNVNEMNTTIHTYYSYDAGGLLVTVTRVAGSTGRCMVDYYTSDLDPLSVTNGDQVATEGLDYTGVSGTLTFDDFEMSKTILIPIHDDFGAVQRNRDFMIYLTNPLVNPAESSEVPAPTVDPVFGQAMIRILDTDLDPNGPTSFPYLVTNIVQIDPVTTVTNVSTNQVWTLIPTNGVFNFEKSNYRVPRDVTSSGYWGATPVTLYVNRMGTNRTSQTIFYHVNVVPQTPDPVDNRNNEFPLSPGSDYATPSPGSTGGVLGGDPDFNFPGGYTGTLTFPGGNNVNPQPIQFTVVNNGKSQFNEDFQVTIFDKDSNGNFVQVGMVDKTTVTILANDLNPPAGSVDEYYNADLNYDMIPPVATTPAFMQHPGTDGEVYGIAVMTNDEAVVVGDFFTYDQTSRNCIALVKTNGMLDATFNPGSGANDFVSCAGVDASGKVVVAGAFTSINGTQRNGIARLNANGTLDTTFNPGAGFNGTVWALKVLSTGQILVAGDFTSYNGVTRNYMARVNSDGTLDSSFDPGTELNGPVYAIGVQADTLLNIARAAAGADPEDDNYINVGAPSGVLTVVYNFYSVPDDMRVFYGGTNGTLIYDTTLTNNPTGFYTTVVIPFGPTNGVSTNQITIVMNQGNGIPGTVWDYTATVQSSGANQVTVGGDFTSVGGVSGQDYVTRLLFDGTVDGTFNPGRGANGIVRAVAVQGDGQVVIGGEFSVVNGQNLNHIARLDGNGMVDTNFFCGTGADDTIYSLNYQNSTSLIYVGGAFTSYNGTRRLGFARLNADGTLDTSFLDTAYNQFAGLTRQYFGDSPGTVVASQLQSDGSVLIGGSFAQVGGGQFDLIVRSNSYYTSGLPQDTDPITLHSDVWPEPKVRDGIRSRANFARLVGGSTAGPGNVGLQYNNYSVNKSLSFIYVSLLRNNGSLGPASANFSVSPGLAQPGADYAYDSVSPLYWMDWEYAGPSRSHSDGWSGTNGLVEGPYNDFYLDTQSRVLVSVLNNPLTSGDMNARFTLANPANADQFYLGGQDIPLGVALGASMAPLTIIDDHHDSGTFGFASAIYTGSSSNAPISVKRNGGTYGICSIQYATTTAGSTAILNSDYRAASGTLTFNAGQTNNSFNVTVLQSNYVTAVEKTVNLRLFNPQGPPNGLVSLGLTNAVLRLINANFQGYLNLSSNVYPVNLNSGFATITVTRTVGSKGTLTVSCASTNGTAVSGTDFVGFTNTLTWNSGDVTPRTITVPLLNNGLLGGIKTFGVGLSNPTLNTTNLTALLGANTSATVIITNDNSNGTFQFSRATYAVSEDGGFATIPVNRTGSLLGSATVDYQTADATTVAAGVNYTATSGTLTFTQGQVSASIIVPILNDQMADASPDNFYFTVALSNPSGGASLGAPASANVEIVDATTYVRPPGNGDSTFATGAGMNGNVLALALQSDGRLIAGGTFTSVNGTPENFVARLGTDGLLDSSGFLYGLSGANGSIYSVVSQTDDRVVVGGTFTSLDGVVRNRIGRLQFDGTLDTSFNPGAGADNNIYALVEAFIGGSRKLYAGGAFNTINAVSSHGIARLNNDGTVDTSFNTGFGADNVVYAIAVYPTNSIYAGKLLIGGAFNTYNNFTSPHIARLNVDGTVDTNFDLSLTADGDVHAIAIQNDGKVVIGGNFMHVNGASAQHIARLNTDGTLDATFAANVNGGFDGSVQAIALQDDNRIVIGGDFNVGNGVTRHRITRLLPSGLVDPTINFGEGADGSVNAIVIQPNDGMFVIGGAFTQYNGQPHSHIARVYGGSQAGSGNFEFTTSSFQVEENSVNAVISVRRTGGTSGPNLDGTGDITIHFTTVDGTAKDGINYSNVTTDIAFPPGETLKTLLVPVVDDHVITDTLTNTLILSNPLAPAGLGDQSQSTLYIYNDDSAVSFSSPNYSVSKSTLTGYGYVSVVRLGTTFGTCSVDFVSTTNGTAVFGTDYFPTNTTITFNPGESNKIINIPIVNNNLPQGDKTVIFALTNAVNAVLQDPTNATLTISDTSTNAGQFQFSAPTYVVSEGDGNAYITVNRTNGRTGIVSVHYTTTAGSAIDGVNFTTKSGTLNFGNFETNKIITVPILENGLVQGPVSFTITLSAPSVGTSLTSPTNATVTILDDDAGIAFATATNLAPENFGFANIAVLRLYNTNGAVSVNYATADGTAHHGVNYTTTSGTLFFTNGETIKTVSVPLIDVTNVTGDLQFSLALSGPTGGAQLATPSNTVVVLQDADAGIHFTNSTVRFLKNVGIANIVVVNSNPRVEPVLQTTNDVPLSVSYYTVDGTATAGVDYQAASGTLVFTNGNATNTFPITIYNNSVVTGDRAFSIVLTNVTAPGQLTPPSTQAVVIAESNAGLRFSQTGYTVFKNGIFANINVLRTGFTNSTVSVDFRATNGTALNGANFIATNGTLVFSNGVTSQFFAVPVIANSLVQPNLKVLLQLLNPTNGTLTVPSVATLTILETGGSYVIPAGAQVTYETGAGPANGILDSNETVTVLFAFRDSAGLNVTNLNATLLTTNGVQSPNPTSRNYGPLTVYGHSVSRPYTFLVNGTNALPINPTFALYDNAKFIGTATFPFTVGSWTTSFTNTNAITIRDNTNAVPYPSVINVSGIGNTLVKSTVTLNKLTHTYPADVDALVTAPAGSNTLVMANAGDGLSVSSVVLTFDDAATNSLPQFNHIITSTNKPTSFLPVSPFP